MRELKIGDKIISRIKYGDCMSYGGYVFSNIDDKGSPYGISSFSREVKENERAEVLEFGPQSMIKVEFESLENPKIGWIDKSWFIFEDKVEILNPKNLYCTICSTTSIDNAGWITKCACTYSADNPFIDLDFCPNCASEADNYINDSDLRNEFS